MVHPLVAARATNINKNQRLTFGRLFSLEERGVGGAELEQKYSNFQHIYLKVYGYVVATVFATNSIRSLQGGVLTFSMIFTTSALEIK